MAVNVVLKSVFDDKGLKQAQKELSKIGKTVGVAFAAVSAATVGAAVALTRFGLETIEGAEKAAIAQRRLDQVAQSMGIFGDQAAQVSTRLGKFAEANELIVGVDADVIKSTQAKLLTFKELAATADTVGGSMDRATMAALDLAAAGFGSAETNAVQLGKALQDPIKGITALARAGVTFTQVEKDKIRALVESGNILEAQNLILSAIETQVGGTAEATASAFTKIELATNQVKDAIGEALLPVFEEFADEIVKVTPELSAALAPAAQAVATIFRDEVLPAIKNFTQWLASPQGVKTIKDLTQAVVDSVQNFINFAGLVIRNKDAILTFAIAIGSTIAILKAFEFAVRLAAAAKVALSIAATLTPWGLIATAIFGVVTAITALTIGAKSAANEVEALEMETGALERELQNLKTAFKNGAISQEDYERQSKAVGEALDKAREAANRLNNSSLAKFRSQLGDTRGDAERLVNAQRELFLAMGRTLPTNARPVNPFTAETTGAGGRSGPTQFEQVQKIIKDTQKKLAKAQEDYRKAQSAAQTAFNKATAAATERFNEASIQAEKQKNEALEQALKTHNENVRRIQSDFAQRQADIITQSINRLRDAFASAVRTNVADIFAQDEIAGSVDNLVANLRDRLTASRNLVSNAALLASQGFSQTFIEQVVGAGLETGNELSQAILEATPETQRELRELFGALESESETGMDSLARTMFEKTGLATTELKKLFSQTQVDLAESLKQAQLDYTSSQQSILQSFDDAMASATKARDDAFAQANEQLNDSLNAARDAFIETVNEIKEAFLEQIAAVEGGLGGLKRTVDQLIALMNQLAIQGTPKISTMPSAPTGVTAPVITTLPISSKKPTVVNNNTFNIKSDATQSPAMVGGAVSKAINKYTRGGGGLAAGVGLVAL